MQSQESGDYTIEPIPESYWDEAKLINMLDQHWKLIGFADRPTLEEMRELGIDHLIRAINRKTKSSRYPKGWQLDRLKLQAMIIRDTAIYKVKGKWLYGRRLGL